MQKRQIPFSPPDITEAEIAEVADALRSGWITTGPKTKELEHRLADYIGNERVVCLNSATAAEELNLRVLGVGPGDEVIVPAYTYTATASAVIHVGAKPVFVDSAPGTWEMDYDAVALAINEHTKAIVPVDLGGIMCDYDRVHEVVEASAGSFKAANEIQESLGRVAIVSDCAHSLGARRRGQMAGQTADLSSFSFHAVKNLTTAEGGAATWVLPGVDGDDLYHRYQLLSLHGQSKDALAKTKLGAWEYDIVGPWYKCNMTDVAAAMGLAQLSRYEGLMARRHEIIGRYDEVNDALGVSHLRHTGPNHRSSGHLYLARVPNLDTESRNSLIVRMAERGVACNVHYKPLPMMTAYKSLGWDIADFPNAYAYYENLVSLPLHTKLSDEDVDYVLECWKDSLDSMEACK